MEVTKKHQKLSLAALVVSLLPLATLVPVFLKVTLPDGVRSVWAIFRFARHTAPVTHWRPVMPDTFLKDSTCFFSRTRYNDSQEHQGCQSEMNARLFL